ncbi:MAG TPA: right-handed parallel beta-helix repeat-containing protein [Chitinophagaceae bacterium]|nr:right-handed parallel beta-helix repeat-containing protein [Chitinophagaceae bacterium]
MKLLLLLFLMLCYCLSFSNTYYFSASTGNDAHSEQQAQNMSTPWRSLAKLNEFMPGLRPGDSVLFSRGDVFRGSMIINVSGGAAERIVFGAYGNGSDPVISGFVSPANWGEAGNNTWQADVATGAVNMVLVNGMLTPPGRYPNNGYLIIANAGTNQLSGNELFGAANWTGAEAVIRKNRWVLDRDHITQHAGNTIYFDATSGYQPLQGYGYFIQHHRSTLDLQGEWYFDATRNKFYMHAGNQQPGQMNIQVSTGSHLVQIQDQSFITFYSLRFEGANHHAFFLENAMDVHIIQCSISFTGINAIQAGSSNGLRLQNCTILHTGNIALNANNCSGFSISNNLIRNTGTVPGMGQNNSGAYESIIINGNTNTIAHNAIDSTGYIPITFGGNDVLINNNLITNFAFIKDDGGGIYTWNNQPGAPQNNNRTIRENIILNGIGAGTGTDNPTSSEVHGIYIDDNAGNVTVSGNSIAHCSRYGIYIHNAHDLVISRNTLFNNLAQLGMTHDNAAPNSPIRNVRTTSNIFFARTANQMAAEFRTIKNDLDHFGYFDSNYYCRPLREDLLIFTSYQQNGVYQNNLRDLEGWQSAFYHDLHSMRTPVRIAAYSIHNILGSNKYPNGRFNTGIGGLYAYANANNVTTSWTNAAGLDDGALRVQFNSQSGTYNQASVIIGAGSVQAGTTYVLRFSLRSSNEFRNMQAFLRKSQSPYNDLSERKLLRMRGERSEHEFVFTATASESDASIVFELGEQADPVYLDNIQLYEASVQFTNPDDSIRFEHNASAAAKTITLDGAYIDVKENAYHSSITLKPYTSAVLIKRPGLSVLPMQFVSFSGTRANERVELQWHTSGDDTPGHYDVERSATGSGFGRIGQVPANMRGTAQYRYTDWFPATGNNYYRLRYISGAAIRYSNIIRIAYLNGRRSLHQLQDEDLVLRPNPAINTLQVMINGLPVLLPVTLTIHGAGGSTLRSYSVYLANNQTIINISFLPPGVYTVRFVCDGKTLAGTFIKI